MGLFFTKMPTSTKIRVRFMLLMNIDNLHLTFLFFPGNFTVENFSHGNPKHEYRFMHKDAYRNII